MNLSDIKFDYQDKITNVNARIERYQEIIKDYTSRIKKAEKEENPNINAVIKSREIYEHKIENMLVVREHYQEFVDTADYLLQNINNYNGVLAHSKIEGLEKRNDALKDEVEHLKTEVYLQDKELKRLGISNDLNKSKLRKKQDEIRSYKGLIKAYKQMDNAIKVLEDENEYLKKELKKSNKNGSNLKKTKQEWYSERRKLISENKMLADTNDFLERKVEQLEDYCNHLLSRRIDEPLTMEGK